jgi:hypothetical protein
MTRTHDGDDEELMMVMMKKITTYFNTAHLLQYINHNSKLLQNLVQYAGVLPLTSCCPHCVRIVVYSAAGVRPSLPHPRSFRLWVLMWAVWLLLYACFCTEGLAWCTLPSEADECYRVSVLQSHQQVTTVYQIICGQNTDLFDVCAGAPLLFHIVYLLLHIAADK